MWKLRFLGRIYILRKFVNSILKRILFNGRIVTIPFGPLSKFKWVCNQDHQFWMPLGVYEKETTDWLMKTINPGDIFFDVGSNAGYFSLLGSKCVGESGKVISFDPIQSNCDTIKAHMSANNLNNVVIENLAVSNDTGKCIFKIENNNANSHIERISLNDKISNPISKIQISTISLDDYISTNNIIPDVIKVDVEGAEKLVIDGSTRLLKDYNASWIISTHSEDLYNKCEYIMKKNGYEVESLYGFHHEIICKKIN